MNYDVVIVGAGPAGATLARLIGEHHKVLLIDRREIRGDLGLVSSRKCCGGLLAPDAQAMLSQLGLGLPVSVLVEPQLFAVRAIDCAEGGGERFYQRHYINMDRHAFDRWLLSLVPTDVEVRLGCRFKGYEEDGELLKVVTSRDGTRETVTTRVLVGADGANSHVRRKVAPGDPFPESYFAIQEWFEVNEQQPHFSVLFDPGITDYYAWTIPKRDLLLVGGAFHPKADTQGRFELLKQRLGNHGLELGESVQREGAFIARTTSLSQLSTGRGNVALIGEAGGWISPSSAEGFSYAFRTAVALADALQESVATFHERYNDKLASLRHNILFKNLKSPFMYRPILRRLVMASGLRAMTVRG